MQRSVNELNFASEVLARSHVVPILVNFGAPWCGLCKIFHPLTEQFLPKWEGRMELVSVNADENLKLCNTHRIQTLPTLLLFVNGKVIQRFDRFHDRDDLRHTLELIAIPGNAVSV